MLVFLSVLVVFLGHAAAVEAPSSCQRLCAFAPELGYGGSRPGLVMSSLCSASLQSGVFLRQEQAARWPPPDEREQVKVIDSLARLKLTQETDEHLETVEASYKTRCLRGLLEGLQSCGTSACTNKDIHLRRVLPLMCQDLSQLEEPTTR